MNVLNNPIESHETKIPPFRTHLSERELEVLKLIAEGYNSQGAADLLYLSKRSVDFHLNTIYNKMGVNNRMLAVRMAWRLGILELGPTPPYSNVINPTPATDEQRLMSIDLDGWRNSIAGFSITGVKGLSKEAATQALRADGPNELPSAKPRSIFAIAAEVIREPMFLLLVAGGIIYLLLGDLQEALRAAGIRVCRDRHHTSPGTQDGECDSRR